MSKNSAGATSVARVEVATVDSADLIVGLTREFYDSEDYPFDSRAVYSAVVQLLEAPDLGQIWLVHARARPVGYATVTYGFSIEFGGKFALLDELYIRPVFRSRGLGRHALYVLLDEYSGRGFGTLRLEVEHRNGRALDLYSRLGFYRHDRAMMTRWLTAPRL
ncbi:GNAT family N-acetyltransferase [Nocardia brasiliensis]|uniref:GNAT family N-acetyltransferase n=1 Tax=Nocardia brasiliensis TaxID=37326 RepID=UPI002457C02F|nr:GNAT family N-acetyltransferase [Nocardia brasiliensis]